MSKEALKIEIQKNLNNWIESATEFHKDSIKNLFYDKHYDERYSHKKGKLLMLLELKRYVNNHLFNNLENK